jgi:hypothetical protein
VTNPIYFRVADDTVMPRAPATEVAPQYDNGPATRWHTELSSSSRAALDAVPNISGTELLLRWALGGLKSDSSYVASVMTAGSMIGNYNRLIFTARAEGPMRVSVQLRTDTDERWRRSVYLDDSPREVVVFFDEMRPIGRTSQRRLPLGSVRDVLFVIDRVNTALGTAGKLWIDDVKYGR